jgi:zinc protease
MKMNRKTTLGLLSAALVLFPSLGRAEFKLPSPDRIVLRNGLTVYHLRNTDVPMISFRMLVRGAGMASEPASLEGAAGLTADLLLRGAAGMDAVAVAEALDAIGARLDFSAAEEYAQVGGESLSEHFPKLMEIAAACLRAPAFKDEEFSLEMAQRIDRLKAVKDDPGSAVRYYFQKAYFGSHPMGHLALGTEDSLGRMTVGDIKALFQAVWRPDRTVAAVVGDIDRPKLVTLLEKTLGTWKASGSGPKSVAIPALPRPSGKRLVLVDKPDATQAYFALGAPGYAMGDAVTPEASVMNTLFGGRFTSWLNTELRIKRGLTYGARSSFQAWSVGGQFAVSSYTRNSEIGQMLDITFDLLKKGAAGGFGAEEVESARNYILGQFPPTLETNASKAAAYARLAFYGLGFDYYGKYLNRIAAMDAAGANRAAARLLPAQNWVLVVVGKAAEIGPILVKYGTWEEKKISDPGF